MKLEQKHIEDLLALTPMQEGMLYHYLKDPEGNHYFEQLSLEISGPMDTGGVEQAWNLVIETNEMLRTVFRWKKMKEPAQIILKTSGITLRCYKNTGKDPQRWIDEIKTRDRNEPFDLQQVPFRVTLGQLDSRHYVMIITHHHILFDGWSTGIILKEFLAVYSDLLNRKEPVKPVKTKIREFIRWQQHRAEELKGKEETFWQGYLAGFATPCALSIKSAIPGENKEIIRYRSVIAGSLKGQLERYVKENKITLAALLYGAWGMLLQRYNNSADVMFGTTTAGRSAQLKGIEEMVGLFINTLPLRVQTFHREKAGDLLCRLDTLLRERETYEHTSLLKLKEYSNITGDGEIFDTVLVMENYPLDTLLAQTAGPLSFDAYTMTEQTHYGLTVAIKPAPAGITLVFSFAGESYARWQIERLSRHYLTLLTNLLRDPGQGIPDLEILTAEERKQLLVEFNKTEKEYPGDKTLRQLFEEQAEEAADRTALIGPAVMDAARESPDTGQPREGKTQPALHSTQVTLTYGELKEKSRRLAYSLREKGVKPDTLVALRVERSVEMILGILGVLKAGGAYLPIEPDYPEARVRYMLKDSGANILLTRQDIAGIASPQVALHLHQALPQFNAQPSPSINYPSESLAYTIYTSGSTGKPKGVLIDHRSVVNLIHCQQQRFKIEINDRILQLSSICFDASVEQIFIALISGAALVLIGKSILLDLRKFENYIKDHAVTYIHGVPSFLQMLNLTGNSHVKRILSGGDICPLPLAKAWTHRCDFYNTYGPTETTVTSIESLIREVPGSLKSVPLGRPLDNTVLYILDQWRNPVPPGVAGELFIGGDGLARGYLNNPELTAERFDHDLWDLLNHHDKKNKRFLGGPGGRFFKKAPLVAEGRIYNTGDLARWLPGGEIEFHGRIDQQVKIRGFRIEPGEIESHLVTHPHIKEAVVSREIDKNGQSYLCAYIVPFHSHRFERLQLRNYLSGKLPDYMIPAFFVEIPRIPLTYTGKIDRKALPEPGGIPAIVYAPPENAAQETMVGIWSGILEIDKERIGMDDNFFELGGHSLKATRLIAQVHKVFDVEISIADLFARPTPRELCIQIQNREKQLHRSIPSAEDKEYYPLTSPQKRFYVFQQLEPGNISYNMPELMMIQGKVSRDKFETIFRQLIQRHESLRTTFFQVSGEAVQRVHPSHRVPFAIEYHQRGNKPVARDFTRPFDLSRLPLLRLGLLEAGAESYYLMFDMHHIIADGVSIAIFIKEFLDFYQGDEPARLRLRYRDYVQWMEQRKKGAESAREIKMTETGSEEGTLNLPTDYPRPLQPDFSGNIIRFEIPDRERDALKFLLIKENTTLYMILLGVFNILLAKLSGQENILVGSPMAGRRHHDLQGLFGLFINTLVMRNFPSGAKGFSTFLREVKENALLAYDNQDYQYEELVEKVTLARATGRNPLFDVMFVLQNMENREIEIPGLKFTKDLGEHRTAKFDMTLYCREEDHLFFRWEYNTSLFKHETVERFTRYFRNIIATVLTEPGIKISAIDILPEEERTALLSGFNNRDAGYPRDKTLHHLFEDRVNQDPGSIALAGNSSSPSSQAMTYRELNEKANQWAGALRQRGLGPDKLAALLLERSPEMMVAIFAVLKAGGAYLPINPDYPQERISYILADSGAGVLVTGSDSAAAGKALSRQERKNPEVLLLDPAAPPPSPPATLPEAHGHRHRWGNPSPTSLAYIIYTSGTTGKPKGVMIEHRNVVRLMFNNKNLFDFTARDTWTMFHSYCFDFSVWEMYGALLYGGTLVMVPRITAQNPAEFLEMLKEHRVTVLNQTPSAFYPLVEEELKHRDQHLKLRYVIFGGEALSPLKLKDWKEKYPGTRLINMYGITETTVHVTFKEITPAEIENNTSNIGTPLPTLSTYTVDHYLKLQPLGVSGELCVGGDGLGRGYLNRPGLTSRAFLENPHSPGERLYRSGDLVRVLESREMEYMGRRDHQVKIRGFRIELGEITNHLLSHSGVKEAIILAKRDKTGDQYLCAYIVPHPGNSLENLQLRAYLQEKLPDYMIPAYFMEVPAMPLTSTGKIDRKSLPEPAVASSIDYVAPRDAVEEALANLWAEILGLDPKQTGIHDNFFHLGGHSLKAAGLLAGIHRQFALEIPLAEIFKTPTIDGIAQYIRKNRKGTFLSIEPAAKIEYYPLSSAQKRLYILQQLEPQSIAYNMPVILVLAGTLNREHIRSTFGKLIARHESLRTRFATVNDQPVQRILDTVTFAIEFEDLQGKEENRRGKAADALVDAFIRPFDLSRAPLLRVGLIRTNAEEHILMTDMHHVISDALSKDILITELVQLFRGETLPPLRLRYKDFSQWQNRRILSGRIKKQQEYWLGEFKGKIPELQIPTDFQRPASRSYSGNRETFAIPVQEARQLRELAETENATLFMVILTLYQVLLFKLGQQEDIIVGTMIAGRRHPDLEKLIGVFVNTLALRNYPHGDKTFIRFLREVRKRTLEAFDNQDYQFESLVEELNLERDASRNPLFDVVFAFKPRDVERNGGPPPGPDADTAGSHLEVKPYIPEGEQDHKVKFDLLLTGVDTGEEMILAFEYSSELFKPETVKRFITYLREILAAVLTNGSVQLKDIKISHHLITATSTVYQSGSSRFDF